jgi:hypothetical protein
VSYRAVLMIVGLLPLAVTAASFIAGERMEVVVLRTQDAKGIAHDTKLWIVEREGRPWVRGARPNLGWLERIRHNPRVEVVRDGAVLPFQAVIIDSADAERAIDDAMNAKYGWIERWYELIVPHDPVVVRLDPAP